MEDFGQELAVTKNDIKHLEADIGEIKLGIKEIQTSMTTFHDQIDEKYLRKDEFKKYEKNTSKRLDSISNRSNMILGSFITLLVTALAGLWINHYK